LELLVAPLWLVACHVLAIFVDRHTHAHGHLSLTSVDNCAIELGLALVALLVLLLIVLVAIVRDVVVVVVVVVIGGADQCSCRRSEVREATRCVCVLG